MTCEGCKGFFRRAVKRNARLRCPFRKGTCEITQKTRRQCQACRLRKCLESGMKKEMIMSDAAVEQRRALIRRKKSERPGTRPPGAKGLTEEQRTMIRELMDAQMKTFDTTFSHFKDFRLPEVLSSGHEIPESLQTPSVEEATKWSQIREDLCSLKVSLKLRGEDGSIWNYKPPAAASGKEIFSLLPHMADMSTYMFKGIINFAKVISHFRDLPIEDQISLLKGAAFELCQLRFNTVFNADTGTWECGRLSYCLEDPAGGFQQLLLEPVLKFHYMLKKLQLHKEEYVLMQAISLFSPDRPGVEQRSVVDQLQEQFAIALKAYIEFNRPQPGYRALGPSSGTSTEFSCPVSLSSSSPTMEKPEKGLGPCPADRILLPEAQLLSAWGLHFCHQGMGTARQSPEAPTGSFSNSQQYHNNNKDNVNNNDDNSKSIIAIIH
ncbi:nuclear receptor subfamily 1 group I member 2 isoform X1 [Desmodus rotundus]|uniref:nuclear receptor subfamily 1 group I member 2 isoform X1 n=1 Tax=Desmodus rotundus TaxID=9430 RepID=UPI002380CA80|nr:nuclear receptor subfamily 1 group I member 2 isoform X1 [Desmodus rotundus]